MRTSKLSEINRQRWEQCWLFMVALSGIILTTVYWLCPDLLAALTIFPVWCWFFLGMFLTALGWRRTWKKQILIVTGIWFFFLLAFAEEPRSLFRALFPPPTSDNLNSLRVVSINCSGGDPAVAAGVLAWNPDVVLLQETPSRKDVEKLASKLFGNKDGVCWGLDNALIVRGKITKCYEGDRNSNHFARASVKFPEGRNLEVISLRLMTPPFRFDLWSPSFWRAYQNNRAVQRAQMETIREHLETVPEGDDAIIGGDLNAPQGDAIFRILHPAFRDSFKLAGRGWGNTITSDFPCLRIDQIWASETLQPYNVMAHNMRHSDHRAVVADFDWAAD